MLYRAADTLYQVWAVPSALATAAWRPAADSAAAPALAAFRAGAVARLAAAGAPTDPAGLLRRQVGYYTERAERGAGGDTTAAARRDAQGEAENGRLVLAGAVGWVRPLSCVEALVLDYQVRRFPMLARPTEFHAVLLRRGTAPGDGAGTAGDDSLLVYFAASGAPWPPKADRLFDALEARRRAGWRVAAHLHNHPLYLDRLGADAGGRPAGDVAGALAPSLTDVQFYRALRDGVGLEAALVTDGLATLEVPASDFGRLRARGDGGPGSAGARPTR